MTANQITLILVPATICVLIIGLILNWKKHKKNQPPKVHGPHVPDAGHDAKEIARSKGKGMADGGM